MPVRKPIFQLGGPFLPALCNVLYILDPVPWTVIQASGMGQLGGLLFLFLCILRRTGVVNFHIVGT